MQFYKFLFALFFAISCLKTAHAQNNLSEGFYVDFKNDTVRGFFNFDNLADKKIFFYANKTTPVNQKLTPEMVQQIETLDKVSIRSFIYTYKDQREPLFITKYADGNVALYKAISLNPDEPDIFFISSTKMPLIRKISAINPKIFLNTYFKGCELGTNFAVRYTENSLLAAVTEISKCAYGDEKVVKNIGKFNKIRVTFGVKAGLFLNQSEMVGQGWFSGNSEIQATVKPIFGVIAAIDIANSFKLYTGINYFKREMNDPNSFNFSTFRVCYKCPYLALSANLVEIPIGIHYEFRKIRPSLFPKVFIGASFLIPTSHNIDLTITDCGSSSVGGYKYSYSNDNPNVYPTGKINPSFFAGVGLRKVLKNQSSIELNIKYSRESDLVESDESSLSGGSAISNRYELSVSYLFPFLGK